MLKEKTGKKITKKDSKEIITIKRIRIKFEKKKGWIILNWRAKLKRKINSIKELKDKTTKKMMTKFKKKIAN